MLRKMTYQLLVKSVLPYKRHQTFFVTQWKAYRSFHQFTIISLAATKLHHYRVCSLVSEEPNLVPDLAVSCLVGSSYF